MTLALFESSRSFTASQPKTSKNIVIDQQEKL